MSPLLLLLLLFSAELVYFSLACKYWSSIFKDGYPSIFLPYVEPSLYLLLLSWWKFVILSFRKYPQDSSWLMHLLPHRNLLSLCHFVWFGCHVCVLICFCTYLAFLLDSNILKIMILKIFVSSILNCFLVEKR